jgi:hypothetical protein
VRRLLIGLVLLGTLGLIAELLLMEHFDGWQMLIPLVVLGLGLVVSALAALRPTPPVVRIFQGLMGAFILAGLVGLWLHYRGNEAFELEIAPATAGTALIWKAMRGAVPTLAPGALVQLGLLGLIWAYDHPATRARVTTDEERR